MNIKRDLKLDTVTVDTETPSAPDTGERLLRIEDNLLELGVEMNRLREEMEDILSKQSSLRFALKRLREYLQDSSNRSRSSHENSSDSEGQEFDIYKRKVQLN